MSASNTELARRADTAPVLADSRPDTLLAAIVQLARDPAVDPAKISAMLDMQERLERRQAEIAFTHALQAAQREVPRVVKHGVINMGEKGRIPFAKWEDVDTVLRPVMDRNGFTVRFDMQPRDGGGGVVTCYLQHIGGHCVTATISLPTDTGAGRNNLQAQGSTLSYSKRYLVEMLFNIVRENEDDDGRAGGAKPITMAQAAEIKGLLVETKSDEVQFLRYFSADSVTLLDDKQYTAAINMLNAKKATQSKQ